MTGARMTRLVGGLLGTTGVVSALALAYFGLTSPALPYTKYSLYYVDRLTDPARAGGSVQAWIRSCPCLRLASYQCYDPG